jgi:hypothetical protein
VLCEWRKAREIASTNVCAEILNEAVGMWGGFGRASGVSESVGLLVRALKMNPACCALSGRILTERTERLSDSERRGAKLELVAQL